MIIGETEDATILATWKTSIECIHTRDSTNKIKQILLNFISNAVKFTKEGTISINCKTFEDFSDNIYRNKLIISITDTGIGIKSEEKSKLLYYLNSSENNNYEDNSN